MSEIKCYDLGYASVFVFENYLINQINDDVTISLEHVEDLRLLIKKHYHTRKLVYISNRVNSYTVDPLVYPEVALIPNLLGMAIVTKTEINKKNATFEQLFYKKEFRVFSTLEQSIIWSTEVLTKANIKSKIAG